MFSWCNGHRTLRCYLGSLWGTLSCRGSPDLFTRKTRHLRSIAFVVQHAKRTEWTSFNSRSPPAGKVEFMPLHLSGVVGFYGSSGYGFKVCVFAATGLIALLVSWSWGAMRGRLCAWTQTQCIVLKWSQHKWEMFNRIKLLSGPLFTYIILVEINIYSLDNCIRMIQLRLNVKRTFRMFFHWSQQTCKYTHQWLATCVGGTTRRLHGPLQTLTTV